MSDEFTSEYDQPDRWEGWGPPGADGWEREARRKEKQLYWREKRITELEAKLAEMSESASMACEEPCGSCGGCLYADEVHGYTGEES